MRIRSDGHIAIATPGFLTAVNVDLSVVRNFTSAWGIPITKGVGLAVLTDGNAPTSWTNGQATMSIQRVAPGQYPAAWSAGTYPAGSYVQYNNVVWKASVTTSGIPGVSADWVSQGYGLQYCGLVAWGLGDDPNYAGIPLGASIFGYQRADANNGIGPSAAFGADIKGRITNAVTTTQHTLIGIETGGSDDSTKRVINAGMGIHLVNQGANDIEHSIFIGNDAIVGTFRNAITASTNAKTVTAIPSYRGSWAPSTEYAVHDLVQDGGRYWVCKKTHTSSSAGASGNEPGVGASYTTYWDPWTNTEGPVDNFIWFGPIGASNVPSGTPLFQVDASGNTTVGGQVAAGTLRVTGNTQLATMTASGQLNTNGLLAASGGAQILGTDSSSGSPIGIALFPGTGLTFTQSQQFVAATGSYTVDFAAGSLGTVFKITATVSYNQSASGFGMMAAFSNAAKVQNVPTASANLGPVYTILAAPTITADTKSITQTGQLDFQSAPTFTVANAGTLVSNSWFQYKAAGNINAGASVTTRTAFAVLDVGGTATTPITTNLGVDIVPLSKGVTNIGIRNASTQVYTPTAATLVATSTIPSSATFVTIGAAAAITLTSNPTIAVGVDGQDLLLLNTGANTITIPNNNIVFNGGAASVPLAQNQSLRFVYSATVAKWIETGRNF